MESARRAPLPARWHLGFSGRQLTKLNGPALCWGCKRRAGWVEGGSARDVGPARPGKQREGEEVGGAQSTLGSDERPASEVRGPGGPARGTIGLAPAFLLRSVSSRAARGERGVAGGSGSSWRCSLASWLVHAVG